MSDKCSCQNCARYKNGKCTLKGAEQFLGILV
jgi:hypothetical protein